MAAHEMQTVEPEAESVWPATDGNPNILFGTCRPERHYYAGRTHILGTDAPFRVGLCGLPVDNVWNIRPPLPTMLCPECCIQAIGRLFPIFARLPKR